MKYYYLTDDSEKSLAPFFSKMVLAASFLVVVIIVAVMFVFWPRQPLSSFMIAEKIYVDTKAQDSPPLLIQIDNISDYFIVREGKRKETGTSVTLFLREDLGKKVDFDKSIKYFARHLEFPIHTKSGPINDVGFSPDNYKDVY